jgi:hypothetical protein
MHLSKRFPFFFGVLAVLVLPVQGMAGPRLASGVSDLFSMDLRPTVSTVGIGRSDFFQLEGTVAVSYIGVGQSNLFSLTAEVLTVTIDVPDPDQAFAASSIVVSGTVSDPTATVDVNGLPAVVDGTSWHVDAVPLVEGANTLTALGQTADGRTAGASVDVTLNTLPQLLNVSDRTQMAFSRVFYNRRTQQTSYDVQIENISAAPLVGPLWLVFEPINVPSITLANPTGTTEDGRFYLDLSPLLAGDRLEPGAVSQPLSIILNNPDRARFNMDTGIYQRSGGAGKSVHVGTQDSQPTLRPAFPNPFNPRTQISYSLVHATPVRLVVYNTLGHPVRVLVNRLHHAGVYQVEWDGRDALGRAVASGLYFYRLEGDGFIRTRRMTLLK